MPTRRGFDSFFGYLAGYIDYYDHSLFFNSNYSRGYDMRRNLSVAEKSQTYATELLSQEAVKVIDRHDTQDPLFLIINHLAPHAGNVDAPLQAPDYKINEFKHIKDPKRQVLAAMISVLDDEIGKVVEALLKKGILENTIIFFYSDNGGPTVGLHSTTASNYPLRGQKQSGWEGAVRNIGFVYSPLIEKPQRVSSQLFHVTDLLPTILSFSGVKAEDIDGVNQWETISLGEITQRTEIVNTIDPIDGFSAYIYNNFKIVNGSSSKGVYDGWLGSSTKTDENCYATSVLNSVAAKAIQSIQHPSDFLTIDKITELRNQATIRCRSSGPNTPCNLLSSPCLFDIIDDPCEENNLAKSNVEMMKTMQARLNKWAEKVVEPRNQPGDPASNPVFFNFTWSPWR